MSTKISKLIKETLEKLKQLKAEGLDVDAEIEAIKKYPVRDRKTKLDEKFFGSAN